MFRWGRTEAQNVPELTTVQDYEALLSRDLVIVFKHSPACVGSWLAHATVNQFLKSQPETAVYLVCVRRHRDLSRHIADHTGVQHASPQVLVFRKGQVVKTASHDQITPELLASVRESA